MSTDDDNDPHVRRALDILKHSRRLYTANELGLSENKLASLRDVQTFITDEGLRYIFAPYGVYDRISLQNRLKIMWPAGISFDCIKESYKFSDFDIKAVAREPDFILLHDVLFYKPFTTKLNQEVSRFLDNEFMYTSCESMLYNKRRRKNTKNCR